MLDVVSTHSAVDAVQVVDTGDDPFETALPEGTEPPVDADLQ